MVLMNIHENEKETRIGKAILLIGGSLVVLIVVLGSYALDALRRRRKAWKFQKITKEPKRPKWVSLYDLSMIKKSEVGRFAIYTKYFIRRMEKQRKNEVWKDRSKRITEKIRKILDQHFDNEKIDLDVIPDSTIILCIAMPNFKNRCIPGDFEAIQKGPDDSYYEYQMIGDDRIEACYYNVDGKRYVAGICIYMENPYQQSYEYHTSIILKLLRGPVYAPKEGLDVVAVSNVNETSATMETLISKGIENQNEDSVDKQTLLN
ncbi:hypothetical protein L3Y34_003429 [Caenorhabditis briggsae]|uniref:Uncharacterized protein n=1 Tax=Caenorhabditis briggsae TaxID=6238 RepID=A0AAE9AFW2_CAEBR|nr:hypothetical protein L3Y34_003429 [Caenorhabditis briggsae]